MYRYQEKKVIEGVRVFIGEDKYSKNYDEIASVLIEEIKKTGENPWMTENEWRESELDTYNICKEYIKEGDKILDIGVGTGRLLSLFSNVEKYGIDISIDMAKMAQKKGIEACVGNVEELPYKDSVFDIVICTDVLEHVFDLHKTISEIIRVLKMGGYFVVRVPQNEDMKQYLEPSYPFEYVHVRMFSKESLILYLTKVFELMLISEKETYKLLIERSVKENKYFSKRVIGKLFSMSCKIFPKLKNNQAYVNRYYEDIYRYVEVIGLFKKVY